MPYERLSAVGFNNLMLNQREEKGWTLLHVVPGYTSVERNRGFDRNEVLHHPPEFIFYKVPENAE